MKSSIQPFLLEGTLALKRTHVSGVLTSSNVTVSVSAGWVAPRHGPDIGGNVGCERVSAPDGCPTQRYRPFNNVCHTRCNKVGWTFRCQSNAWLLNGFFF